MKRFNITNKINGNQFEVTRETIEPMQPEWGKRERWSFELPEGIEPLDSREVETAPAVEVEETLDPETGEIQPGFTTEAVMQTEYLLPAEYEITETDISEELEQQEINDSARAYLSETDWIVTRFVETGVPIPSDVKVNRAKAREAITKI